MAKKYEVTAITSDRPALRHLTRALASAGFLVHECSFDRYQIADELDKERDLYLIDGDENTTEAGWLLHQLVIREQGLVDSSILRSLVFAHEAEHNRVLDLISDVGIYNFISRHGDSSQRMLDEGELIVSCRKLLTKDIFGLEKYFGMWGLEHYQHTIASNRDKIDAIEQLERFLSAVVCNRRIMPGIAMAAEELVMNALFVAPRDEQGKIKYANVDRRDPFTLEAGEEATISWACDGCYVGLSVSDPHGSLTRDVVMRYLKHCFHGTKEMDESKGRGAKLGLYMLFNTCTQLIFNLDEGNRTEVVALFYIRGGARAFKESGRSLNIFSR